MKIKLPNGTEAWLRISHNNWHRDGRRFTSVTVVTQDTSVPGCLVAHVGYAYCSQSDHFCRKTGRKIALTRLIAKSNFDKSTRMALWFAVCPTVFTDHQKQLLTASSCSWKVGQDKKNNIREITF